MKTLTYLVALLFLLAGCSETRQSEKQPTRTTPSYEQLNVSILLDLSDRIEANRSKDQELISYLAEYFKTYISGKNLFFIHDRMQVLFYPTPHNDSINAIGEALKVKLDPRDKEGIKLIWENVTDTYSKQIVQLYELALKEGESSSFPGSDIYRFFSEKVMDYCIEPDSQYRNILIIFTDGYLYHRDSQSRIENRTTYITGPFLENEGLRNNPSWEEKFREGDYGLISRRKDLHNLEILVLEVNPSQKHRDDDEIIRKFWSQWFDEMGVKRHKICTTDLPGNTKALIEAFLKTETYNKEVK